MTKAVDTFIGKKAEIDDLLARLQASSDDHFNCPPDAINWGDVGLLEHIAAQLRDVAAFADA